MKYFILIVDILIAILCFLSPLCLFFKFISMTYLDKWMHTENPILYFLWVLGICIAAIICPRLYQEIQYLRLPFGEWKNRHL